MLEHLYDALRLGMSEKEKENFRRQLVGRIRIDLQQDGTLRIKLAEE